MGRAVPRYKVASDHRVRGLYHPISERTPGGESGGNRHA